MKSLIHPLFWLSLVLLLGCLGYVLLRPSQPHAKGQESLSTNSVPAVRVDSKTAQGSANSEPLPSSDTQSQFSPSDLPITMKTGELMVGQVVAPSFEGISKATITVHSYDEAIIQKQIHTDQEGHFSLPYPARLPLSVEVSAQGFITRRLDFPEEDALHGNKIILKPGGQLEVRLEDEHGQPIAGARIATTTEDGVVTNRAGLAELSKLRNPAQLFIQAEGFMDLRRTLELEPLSQTITLMRYGYLKGQVRDQETDQPIGDYAIKWQNAKSKRQTRTIRHAQGRFELTELPRRKAPIIISAPGYVTKVFHPDAILPKGQGEAVEIYLEHEGLYFSGHVRESSGSPIAGATVIALVGDAIDGGKKPLSALPKRVDGQWIISEDTWVDTNETRTDADGHFIVGPLPSNSYLGLFSYAEGFAPKQMLNLEMLVLESREKMQVVLEKYGRLSGRAGQDTYPGVRVVSIRDASRREIEIKLSQGEQDFAWDEVIPGSVTVRFHAGSGDHHATGEIPDMIPDEQEVTITAEETKEIRIGFDEQFTLGGRILLDGHPMVKGPVVVIQKKEPRRSFRTQTDDSGYFSVHPLKRGDYEIMANGSSDQGTFGAKNRKLVKLSGHQSDLLFEFQSMGSVYGRIVSEPVGDQVVMEIEYPAGNRTIINSRKTAIVQAKGFFEFHHVPIGKFDLLLGTLANTPQMLVRDQPMPEDGTDLDLGDLGAQDGELYLNLSGPESFQQMEVLFTQRSLGTQDHRASLVLTKLKPAKGQEHITGLELGALEIKAEPPRGFTVTPAKTELLIEEGVVPTVNFKLEAHTFLEVIGRLDSSEQSFKKAILIQESSQRQWHIPKEEAPIPSEVMGSGPTLYHTPLRVIARDIPEGWWQVHVTNRFDMVAKRRFRIIKGQPVVFILEARDFTP